MISLNTEETKDHNKNYWKRISLAACIPLPSFHIALLGNIERGLCLLCPQALVKIFLIMINYIPIKISSTRYTNNRTFSLNTTLFINYRAVCCKNKIPAENVLLVTMFFIFSQRLEKHIHFLAKCALARGSSAYWRFSLCGLNCYGCCLWRCYDKCEGQAW